MLRHDILLNLNLNICYKMWNSDILWEILTFGFFGLPSTKDFSGRPVDVHFKH